jgi:hypothetical protein
LNLDETWTTGFCLYLVSIPTHEEEFEVHTRNLLASI